MLSDEDLLAQMALQEESPDDPRQRRVVKPKYAKSLFNLDDLRAKFGDRVWVKCITDVKPWSDEKPLDMWKDYLIPIHEAIMLDERRFAVILISQEMLKELQPLPEVELEEEEVVVKPPVQKAQPKVKPQSNRR